MRVIGLLLVGVLMCLSFLGGAWWDRNRGALPVVVALPLPSRDPGFNVREPNPLMPWYAIQNAASDALVVEDVRVNGESQAPAHFRGSQGTRVDYPVTLPAGEYFTAVKPDDYARGVAFVDIVTNRGTFRYRDGLIEQR